MNGRIASTTGLLLAGALCLPGCNPPKYVTYASIHKDWQCSVPWGWSVMTDEEGSHFTHTNFIGPFEPEFYLGAPSLTVKWYAYGYPHRLPDGLLEVYDDVDDYIKQTIDNVYGPRYQMVKPVQEIKLAGGRKAKHFVVLSAAPVPQTMRWGTEIERKTNKLLNVREHAYAAVPLKRGFYVLIYPATREGFKLYEPQFNEIVNTFTPLQEGPDGAKLETASAQNTAAKAFSR